MKLKTIKEDLRACAYKSKHKNKKLSLKIVILMLLTPEFRVVLSYRIYSYLNRVGFQKTSHILYLWSKRKYSTDIHPSAIIGVPFKLGHHMSIVIGPKVVIGKNCYFMNNVTLGNKELGGEDRMPVISDNVVIGVGAKLLGAITVAKGATIGANSVVTKNIGFNEVWAGAPAKLLR
jgi:serine O-acetyltransferase